MEPGIYAGLIYVVLHIIKKAVKLVMTPSSRQDKKAMQLTRVDTQSARVSLISFESVCNCNNR